MHKSYVLGFFLDCLTDGDFFNFVPENSCRLYGAAPPSPVSHESKKCKMSDWCPEWTLQSLTHQSRSTVILCVCCVYWYPHRPLLYCLRGLWEVRSSRQTFGCLWYIFYVVCRLCRRAQRCDFSQQHHQQQQHPPPWLGSVLLPLLPY
jgi:hypothetical protein